MSEYAEYLKLDELLSLQQPRTENLPTELTFIVAHQVFELWFRLIISDLQCAVRAVDSDDLRRSMIALRRVNAVERLMLEQLVLMEHLDLHEFTAIRKRLGKASAKDSEQFARIEALSTFTLPSPACERSKRDLWSAFCNLTERRTGLSMPTEPTEAAYQVRVDSLRRLYAGCDDGHEPLRDLCEVLTDHDEGFALWRYRHCMTAFRKIGRSPGTGQTAGVAFLERRLGRRFYPEVWDAVGSPDVKSSGVDA